MTEEAEKTPPTVTVRRKLVFSESFKLDEGTHMVSPFEGVKLDEATLRKLKFYVENGTIVLNGFKLPELAAPKPEEKKGAGDK